MHNIKISFCVVTYNNENSIKKLLLNIENSIPNFVSAKIFVVDNLSTDRTISIVKTIQKDFTNVKLIQSAVNNGFGAGNNQVLPFLDSDYHILINPDITISKEDTLNKMILYMQSHPSVGLLSPKILNVDGSVQKLYKHNPSVLDMALRFISPKFMKKRQSWFVHDETKYGQRGLIENASGAFMFFRTTTFKKVGGFDEKYFMYMEDADITRKVNQVSTAMFIPETVVIHEWQRNSHRKIKYIIIMIHSMTIYFKKWGWKLC